MDDSVQLIDSSGGGGRPGLMLATGTHRWTYSTLFSLANGYSFSTWHNVQQVVQYALYLRRATARDAGVYSL